jgi:hypothetical protein
MLSDGEHAEIDMDAEPAEQDEEGDLDETSTAIAQSG